MRDLEQTLIQIGRELDWPETPDLASSVMARLEAIPAEPSVDGAEPPPRVEPAPPAATPRPRESRDPAPRGAASPASSRRTDCAAPSCSLSSRC